MSRQQKTPRQRAEETLAVAQRKRDRLVNQAIQLHKQTKALDAELEEAERRLDYAEKDPALPPRTPAREKSTTATSSTTSNQSGDTA
jgi:hypothetical protein